MGRRGGAGCLAGEESWEKQERGRSWEMPGSMRQRGLSVDITANAGQGLRFPRMEKLGMERGLDLSYPAAEHPLPAPCADPGGLGSLWMQSDPVAGKEHSSPPNPTGSPGVPRLGGGSWDKPEPWEGVICAWRGVGIPPTASAPQNSFRGAGREKENQSLDISKRPCDHAAARG